jgi:hypothetical protein
MKGSDILNLKVPGQKFLSENTARLAMLKKKLAIVERNTTTMVVAPAV